MNGLEDFNAAQLQVWSRGVVGFLLMSDWRLLCVCGCLRLRAHTWCVYQNTAAGHLCTVWIDSNMLDPYALDS